MTVKDLMELLKTIPENFEITLCDDNFDVTTLEQYQIDLVKNDDNGRFLQYISKTQPENATAVVIHVK